MADMTTEEAVQILNGPQLEEIRKQTDKSREQLAKKKEASIASYWESYYSGCDVVILIGSTWVDDIITIQYTLSNNKSPVYGYMSEQFDAVAKGNRLVNGQFAVAFKEIGYIPKILQNYAANVGQSVSLLSANDKSQVITVPEEAEYLNNFKRYAPDRFGYTEGVSYGDYIKKEGFDIVVAFGDVSETYRGGTVEILNNCHITSRSLICEPSGEPIAEMYSFFGRALNEYIPKYSYIVQEDIANSSKLNALNKIQDSGASAPIEEIKKYILSEDAYITYFLNDRDVSFVDSGCISVDGETQSAVVVESKKDLSEYGRLYQNELLPLNAPEVLDIGDTYNIHDSSLT